MLAEWSLLLRTRIKHSSLVSSLVQNYKSLSTFQREQEIQCLINSFGFKNTGLNANLDQNNLKQSSQQLRISLRSDLTSIFQQISVDPKGIAFLVQLRGDLLGLSKTDSNAKYFCDELKLFFKYWFTPGCLQLSKIDPRRRELVQYCWEHETVQPVEKVADYYERFENDRRIYCLSHPSMPNEPLIFVQVALLPSIPTKITNIWDYKSNPDVIPNTAVFYSINACVKGLAGLDLGVHMIKHALVDLLENSPNVHTFCTLSPIPRLSQYLSQQSEYVQDAFKNGNKTLMKQIVANYILHENHCPVKNFHCRNGAKVGPLRHLGDESPLRLKQSHGMMVNYIYEVDNLEANCESFKHGNISHVPEIAALLRKSKL